MKKMKRLLTTLGITVALTLNIAGPLITTENVAQAATFSPVIAKSIPEEVINTKINMVIGSNSQKITAVQAKNIPDEIVNTEINMGISTGSQKITAVNIKNIPEEEVTTKVPFNF